MLKRGRGRDGYAFADRRFRRDVAGPPLRAPQGAGSSARVIGAGIVAVTLLGLAHRLRAAADRQPRARRAAQGDGGAPRAGGRVREEAGRGRWTASSRSSRSSSARCASSRTCPARRPAGGDGRHGDRDPRRREPGRRRAGSDEPFPDDMRRCRRHVAAPGDPEDADVAEAREPARRVRRVPRRDRARGRATASRSCSGRSRASARGSRRRRRSGPSRGWLTSRFGYRISPFTNRKQFHAGIDIAGAPGTDVVAPARGRVVFAGPNGPLGNCVDHRPRLRRADAVRPQSGDCYVKPGQVVERGQRIAALGNSGRSTGPHLHYRSK